MTTLGAEFPARVALAFRYVVTVTAGRTHNAVKSSHNAGQKWSSMQGTQNPRLRLLSPLCVSPDASVEPDIATLLVILFVVYFFQEVDKASFPSLLKGHSYRDNVVIAEQVC